MATSAAPRASDLQSRRAQGEMDALPPRPSISPLSNPPNDSRSSPAPARDDRSSSLSEPMDDEREDDAMNDVNGGGDDEEQVAAHKSLEVDSEAETDRLDQTPQKARQNAEASGKTPSKLKQAEVADDELSDPPSPLPAGAGAGSSASDMMGAGQKRKRSESADSSLTSAESDLEESPRKRSHEWNPDEHTEVQQTVEQPEEQTELPEPEDETTLEEKANEAAAAPGTKSKKGKQKGRKRKEPVEEAEVVTAEEVAEPDEEPAEDDTAKTEEELKFKKDASGLFEDVTNQFRAFKERLYNERLDSLTSELKLLSDPDSTHPEYLRQAACVTARTQKQTRESHAYHNYRMRSIRERTLGERSQLHSQFHQQVRDLRERTMEGLGKDWYDIQKERRQTHQGKDESYMYKFPTKRSVQIRQQANYNQEVSVLSGLAKHVGFPAAPALKGAEGDQFEDDLKLMKIPKRVQHRAPPPQQPAYLPQNSSIAQKHAQNERLAHEQFIEQNAWAQPQPPLNGHGTPGPGSISHTPDWADTAPPSSARNLIRNLGGQLGRSSSPFATPAPQRRGPLGAFAMNNEGGDSHPPSNMSSTAQPPATDRISFLQQVGSAQQSPLAHNTPITVSKQRATHHHHHHPPGSGERELTGFRNISGISGTSTIDAPLEPDSAGKQGHGHREYPHAPGTDGLPRQPFETSQLHGGGREGRRETPGFLAGGFRAAEGPLGTPAPLPGGAGG